MNNEEFNKMNELITNIKNTKQRISDIIEMKTNGVSFDFTIRCTSAPHKCRVKSMMITPDHDESLSIIDCILKHYEDKLDMLNKTVNEINIEYPHDKSKIPQSFDARESIYIEGLGEVSIGMKIIDCTSTISTIVYVRHRNNEIIEIRSIDDNRRQIRYVFTPSDDMPIQIVPDTPKSIYIDGIGELLIGSELIDGEGIHSKIIGFYQFTDGYDIETTDGEYNHHFRYIKSEPLPFTLYAY